MNTTVETPRRLVKCALCGYEFDPAAPDAAGKCRACPMNRFCHMLCCPKCGYSTPAEKAKVKRR